MPEEEFNKKELLNWIETQPELDYLRRQANKTKCDYRTTEKTNDRRIRPIPRTSLPAGSGFFGKIVNAFWVPGKNLRGKSYASKEHDKTLDQTAKVMSLSTIWDFICTYPIFLYALKGVRGFGYTPIPIATAISLFVLWFSNVSGENSTNRTRSRVSRSNISILAFLLLSIAKTALSGVGLEMMLNEQGIMEEQARKIRLQTVQLTEQIAETVTNNDAYTALLVSSQEECNRLEKEQDKISRRWNNRRWEAIEEQKFREPNSPTKIDNEGFITNLNGYGACKRASLILNAQAMSKQGASQDVLANQVSKASGDNLAALYITSRSEYYKFFQGNPLEGFDVEGFRERWASMESRFETDCNSEKCEGEVRWVNGGDAISAAFTQFFEKIKDPSRVASLSLSLYGFIISIILSTSAAALLIMASKNKETRASFSNMLSSKSNQILEEFNDN
tara:strand:- start:2032 stop:3375 length:1344 start_codon:yes stop_codon:yes gene_type:complete